MTTFSLDFPERRVRIDIEDVWMRAGLGGHEVRFSMKVQAPWLPDDSPASYEMLSLQVRVEAGRANSFRPLSHGILTCLARRYPASEDLLLVITDEQLLGLQAVGDEVGVEFQFDIVATLSNQNDGRPAWTSTQQRHWVPRGRWAELLAQVGAAATISVRVPTPFTDAVWDGRAMDSGSSPRSASQASRRLLRAQQQFWDGDFDGCVQTCRLVLDNVKALSQPEPVNRIDGVNRKDRNQAQRWWALLHDLYSLTSGAHHDDDVTHGFSWSRTDAQAALAMTAALLSKVP